MHNSIFLPSQCPRGREAHAGSQKRTMWRKYSSSGISGPGSFSTHVFFSLHLWCCLITCTNTVLFPSHKPKDSPLYITLFLTSPLQQSLPVSRNSHWESEELFHSLCQYFTLFCMKNMCPTARNVHYHLQVCTHLRKHN